MENNTNSTSSDRQDHAVLNVANPQADVAISVGSLQTESSSSSSSGGSSSSGNGSTSRSTSDGGSSSSSNPRHRRSPLNSRLWICIEVAISVSQIIASIIVLSLSTDEKPRVPLSIWVSGYALGCLATLPLLYRRYAQLHATRQGQGHSNYTAGMSVPQGEESRTAFQSSRRRGNRDAASGDSRLNVFVERFKMALDCFFAIWFVVGNVWIFGGHSSSSEAPNLYRLCIVFLTFSCIGYAMPFVLCVTICCCLPCIISLLRLQEDQIQIKGASPEVIDSLQTYKFKAKDPNNRHKNKDDVDSDSESSNEGVFVSAGTGKERAVSAPDAVCSICLGKYKDGVELRELPCTHHFHIECIDKWLKINASCPLCKHEVAESIKAAQEASEAEQRDNTNQCG